VVEGRRGRVQREGKKRNLSGLVELLSKELLLHSRVPRSDDVLAVLPSSVVSSSSSTPVAGSGRGSSPATVGSRRRGREPSRGSSESSSGRRGSGPAVRRADIERSREEKDKSASSA